MSTSHVKLDISRILFSSSFTPAAKAQKQNTLLHQKFPYSFFLSVEFPHITNLQHIYIYISHTHTDAPFQFLIMTHLTPALTAAAQLFEKQAHLFFSLPKLDITHGNILEKSIIYIKYIYSSFNESENCVEHFKMIYWQGEGLK